MENAGRIEGCSVQAKFETQLGCVEVLQGSWQGPHDVESISPLHHLQLNLHDVPGGTKSCFVDHWSPNRFASMGNMFFLPADQRVRFISNCRQQQAIACEFTPGAIDEWLECRLPLPESRLEALLNLDNQRIKSLLFKVGEEIRTRGILSEYMTELLIAQLVVELVRHFHVLDDVKTGGGLSARRLRLIKERVADMTAAPTLVELAKMCNLSVRHLNRAFTHSMGISLGSYIADQRAQHAKQLIASGMSIKTVAYNMGYSSPANFSTSFSRMTGLTPTQFRQDTKKT